MTIIKTSKGLFWNFLINSPTSTLNIFLILCAIIIMFIPFKQNFVHLFWDGTFGAGSLKKVGHSGFFLVATK